MTESTTKKTTAGAKKAASGAKKTATSAKSAVKAPLSFLPKVELPKVSLPKVELPKFEVPKVELPKVSLPKVELPKFEVPGSVSAVTERGRGLVQDSVKSAQGAVGSVRKNVGQTVVLVREVVGV